MKQNRPYLILCVVALLLGLLTLAGCKSTSKVARTDSRNLPDSCLMSKLELSIPHNGAVYTVNGTMRVRRGQMVQVSLLMPVLRSEVARVELTPQYLLLVDRMNRRYFKATQAQLRRVQPRNATYNRLETMLWQAAKTDGKCTLSGADLGIAKLGKARVELYDFSNKPFILRPMELTDRYREVTMDELLQLLSML